MTTGNPFIDPENYFDGYNESIQNLKNNPDAVSFEKLCYEVFHCTDAGKFLMTMIEQRYLLPSLVDVDAPNYAVAVIESEGFKNAFRLLRKLAHSHLQRINAEINK